MKDDAYKQAGVDIEAGNALVQRIKPHTQKTIRPGLMGGIGGFGAFFDLNAVQNYKKPVLVSSTDGVGTKLRIAIDAGLHKTIGIDCVAMCVNDIAVHGAEPLFFLDYFATGALDVKVAEDVIAGIATGCKQAGCALIGGETAEMPGMYEGSDYDLAGFTVGAVEKDEIIDGSAIEDGDVIFGLASDGLHSNGYSLVRRIIETTQGLSYDRAEFFTGDKTLAEELLKPTRIYVKSLLEISSILDKDGNKAVHGMAHITGGGLPENLPRIIPPQLAAEIDVGKWRSHPVFSWLMKLGNLDADNMLRTFNCGIGMVVIVKESSAEVVRQSLLRHEKVFEIGHITQNAYNNQIIFTSQEDLCQKN